VFLGLPLLKRFPPQNNNGRNLLPAHADSFAVSHLLCPLSPHNNDNRWSIGTKEHELPDYKTKKRYIKYFWLLQIALPFCQKRTYILCEALSPKSDDSIIVQN